jgi:hypothetical protein
VNLYCVATAGFFVFTAYKLARNWHEGFAEKTGHVIDSSISTAAEKLEQTAVALEEWAGSGFGENMGKDIDKMVMDAKNTLEKTSDLVSRTMKK